MCISLVLYDSHPALLLLLAFNRDEFWDRQALQRLGAACTTSNHHAGVTHSHARPLSLVLHRPTQPAHFWPDEPSLLAGRDALRKGTWMGVTKHGRFALLTNYREV